MATLRILSYFCCCCCCCRCYCGRCCRCYHCCCSCHRCSHIPRHVFFHPVLIRFFSAATALHSMLKEMLTSIIFSTVRSFMYRNLSLPINNVPSPIYTVRYLSSPHAHASGTTNPAQFKKHCSYHFQFHPALNIHTFM